MFFRYESNDKVRYYASLLKWICRPICKNRRREWHGVTQNTSAELLLERKPLPDCIRRWPTKVYPNSPCPLLGRTRRIVAKERNAAEGPTIVRICQAPIDDQVDTPYLEFAEMAKRIGAWGAVAARCAFCACGACPCCKGGYQPRDAERSLTRRADMHQFDARVKMDCPAMKNMYDNN